MSSKEKEEDHITPYEILSLVDTAREKTKKLNRKIKNATFHGVLPDKYQTF